MKRLARPVALPVAIAIACAGLVGSTGTANAGGGIDISGRAVDSSTENGLRGVIVTARDVVDRSIIYARTTTGADGRYTLRDIPTEEVGLRFNGEPVDHETGWQSCSHTVVQKWGNACSWGEGWVGWARLQRL